MVGKFFTFEGGEGSGKSTQSKLLQQAFAQAGIEAILTREPGGTEAAEAIRELLLHGKVKFYPLTEVLLHNAARFEHAKGEIIPALKNDKIVICDRFVDSTVAYQGYGHKIGKKIPALLHNILMEGLIPDLTFILDINPKLGLQRAKNLGEHDNYEKLDLEFHNRVREGFLDIANMAANRCIIIDATQDFTLIHQKIIEKINELGFKLTLQI